MNDSVGAKFVFSQKKVWYSASIDIAGSRDDHLEGTMKKMDIPIPLPDRREFPWFKWEPLKTKLK
jgi:hypothetical protein